MKKINLLFRLNTLLLLTPFVSVVISLLLLITLNLSLYGQDKPTKKGNFSFNSTLGHGDSEDWPVSIFPSSDCIHVYFAGWTVYVTTDDCNNQIKFRAPMIGKYNSLTNVLVWEKEYYLYKSSTEGGFNSVIEMGGYVWAVGSNFGCHNDGGTIIVKANANTGEPEAGYPQLFDPPNGGGNMYPLIENGQVTGMLGNGSRNGNAILFVTDENGNLSTNFGTNGYFTSPTPNSKAYRMIKIKDHPTIKYIYTGYKTTTGDYGADILIGALDENGNLIHEFIIDESDLGTNYDDMTNDESLCGGYPGIFESGSGDWGWDLVQDDQYVYLSIVCDGIWWDDTKIATECIPFNGLETYHYEDVGILKLEIDKIANGINSIISKVNVGVNEAADYYPDIELNDGKIYILGAKTTNLKTDGKISVFDTDLKLIDERTFDDEDWDINCSFDMAFNCDGELIISGDNDIGGEDYYFYKFSNGCQQEVAFNGVDDILTKQEILSGMDVTWSTDRKVKAPVIVRSGGILRIEGGAVIEFGASWDLVDYDKLALPDPDYNNNTPRIIVEGNGRLFLNNCTLKGLSACTNNSMWDGVEVRNGGKLTMNTGAQIQDAKFGILADLGQYNNEGNLKPTESSGGGEIVSDNAYLINCRRGIHFAKSDNNTSHFDGTHFLCTGPLKDPSFKTIITDLSGTKLTTGLGTSEFVYSSGIKNSAIKFNSCEFNNSSNLFIELRGDGIKVFDTPFEITQSTFNQLYHGIFADNSNLTDKYVSINNLNQFIGNRIGVRFRGGIMNKVINHNTFESKSYINNDPHFQIARIYHGIGILNQSSLKIDVSENNNFNGNGQDPYLFGILSENTTDAVSHHIKNNFFQLAVGEKTQGATNKGLVISCNDFNQQNQAWSILGLFRDQGKCDFFQPNTSYTPNNKFRDGANSQNSLNHIRSNVNFIYHLNDPNQSYRPIFNTPIKVATPSCGIVNIQSGCEFRPLLSPGNVVDYHNQYDEMDEGMQRDLLGNDLLSYYSSVGDMNNFNLILSGMTDDGSRRMYSLHLLNQGNSTQAYNIASGLDMNDADNSDFLDVLNIYIALDNAELGLNQMSESQIDALEDMSDHRTQAGYISQSILTQYYGYTFPIIIEQEDSSLWERSGKDQPEVINLKKVNLIITPNPVNDAISINYSGEMDKDLVYTISITSNDAKKREMTINTKIIQPINLNVNDLAPGLYSVSLWNDGKLISSKRFIKY